MLEIEVPQDLWYNIMLTAPSTHQQPVSTSSTLAVESYPVESVSWENCQQFIDELNSSSYVPTGFYFALPTEAQWEYACRAGGTGASVSDEELDLFGWYRDNCEGATHPSKEKKPNKWGFYDMLGNVSEWCLDSADAGGGSAKAYRGGSWVDYSRDCRPAARRYLASTGRSVSIGFRLVLNHETPAETEETTAETK